MVSRSSSGRRSVANLESTGGESLVSGRNHRAQWNSAPGMSLRIFDPFPARMRCRLRYNENIAIPATTAGTPSHYLFKANGFYDPNTTGSGHQPMGYDTYASLYHHYKVVSSVISVTPSSAFNMHFGVGLIADSNYPTGYYDVAENKGVKWAMNSSASTVPTVTNYYNKNLFPNSDSVDLGALVGSDPNELTNYDIWMRSTTSTGTDTEKYFTVCIEYICDWWELRTLPQS